MGIDLTAYKLTKAKASNAIEGIAGLADRLQMLETAATARRKAEDLRSDTFRLMVAGRFKNGKSTLMNALLGKTTVPVPELPAGKGPMPVDDLPCTAVLTSITYSTRPYVRAWRKDGTLAADWDLTRYLVEATIKEDDEDTQQFFRDIKEFEVGFPNELCKEGITLIDSPGTDDMPDRTAITLEAASHCDAAIAVYRSDVFAGESDRNFTFNVLDVDNTEVFTVVNMFSDKQQEPRFRAFVWNRLMKLMRGAPAYAGQSFEEQKIYFVNAARAEKGRLSGDDQLVAASGIEALEKRLTDFLMNERYRQHIEKFVKGAQKQSLLVTDQIGKRRLGLTQEAQHLRQVIGAARPKLDDARARKDHLPELIERYRRDAQRELQLGFESLINEIRLQLPEALHEYKLPSANKALSLFYQKAMTQEAFAFCEGYVQKALNKWKDGDAQRRLEPVLDRMFREIQDEVTQMEQAYRDVYMDIGAVGIFTLKKGEADAMTWFQRILWAGAGILMHDVGMAVAGGVLGWRGFLGQLGGYLTGAIVVAIAGVTGVAAIPLVLVSGLLGQLAVAKVFLENRIKDKVLEVVLNGDPDQDPPIPGLRDAPKTAAPALLQQINVEFDKIKLDIMKKLGEILDQEEHNLANILADAERDASEKQRLLREYDQLAQNLAVHTSCLNEVIISVKQQLA